MRLASTPLEFTEWYLLGVALPLGSFVGVIVERLPEAGSPLTGRSSCTHCGAALTLRDLVPLASWLAMRGRCRHCGAWLGWFYPCVELAALAVAMLSLVVDRGADAWIDAALGWWLLALAWIDWRHMILPDALTLPLIPFGLLVAATWSRMSCGTRFWAPLAVTWGYARSPGSIIGRPGVMGSAGATRSCSGQPAPGSA